VKVSDGYSVENYLNPSKKGASRHREKPQSDREHQKPPGSARGWKRQKKMQKRWGNAIEVLSCTFVKTVGESGKLFGSVTSMDIENYLKDKWESTWIAKKISLEETHQKFRDVYRADQTPFRSQLPILSLWVFQE